MKNTVLLLTSCINPGGMQYTVLQDKEERKKQYIQAVKFYLENTKFRIVLCDNSGEDLTELKEIEVGPRLEILSFQGNDYDTSLGKGFGEFGIVQYAFQNSRFLKEATSVVKITGRLIVKNLIEILRLHEKLFFYPKRYVYVEDNAHRAFDSRCIVANKEFFSRHFLVSDNPINDSAGYYFEHYLYDSIQKLPQCYVVSDFALPLAISGVSGTSGIEYEFEELDYGKKLAFIRDFCQYKRKFYKNYNGLLYVWLSFVSFIIRVKK